MGRGSWVISMSQTTGRIFKYCLSAQTLNHKEQRSVFVHGSFLFRKGRGNHQSVLVSFWIEMTSKSSDRQVLDTAVLPLKIVTWAQDLGSWEISVAFHWSENVSCHSTRKRCCVKRTPRQKRTTQNSLTHDGFLSLSFYVSEDVGNKSIIIVVMWIIICWNHIFINNFFSSIIGYFKWPQ